MRKKAPQKPYWEMSLKELQEATKEFDAPIDFSKTRPLSKRERLQWDRARRGGSISVTALVKPASLTIVFDERFLKNSMKKALQKKVALYNVMEAEFRSAVKWFERTWAWKDRR